MGVVLILYVIAFTTYKNSNYESFSKTQKRANKAVNQRSDFWKGKGIVEWKSLRQYYNNNIC